MLRKYRRSGRFHKNVVIHLEATDVNEAEIYAIEAIIKHRPVRSSSATRPMYEYLIKWKGYDTQQSTYIRECDFVGPVAKALLQEYKRDSGLLAKRRRPQKIDQKSDSKPQKRTLLCKGGGM